MRNKTTLNAELKSFGDYMRKSGYSNSSIGSYKASIKKSTNILGISLFDYIVTLKVNNLNLNAQQVADKVWNILINVLDFSGRKAKSDFRAHIRLASKYLLKGE